MEDRELSIATNPKFIRALHPARVCLLSLSSYALLYLTTPIEFAGELSDRSLIYIALCIIAFLIGSCCIVAPKTDPQPQHSSISEHTLSRIFYTSMLLAVLGVGIKLYDRLFVRHLTLSNEIFQNRELAEAASSNIFGVIGSSLFLFSLVPLFLIYLCKDSHFQKYKWLAFSIFFYSAFDGLLLGSRNAIIINLFMFVAYLLYFRKLRINLKTALLTFAMIGLMTLVISGIFKSRLSERNTQIEDSMYGQGYASSVPPKDWYARLLEEHEGTFVHDLLFTYIHSAQYVLHGLYEFSELVKFADEHERRLYGKNTFFVYAKLFDKLTGDHFDVMSIAILYPRPGLFTTFFGPLYLDFDWFGIAFMFLFGLFQGWCWRRSLKGDFLALPLYFWLSFITLFVPIINSLMGTGNYAVTTLAAFWAIGSLFKKRFVFQPTPIPRSAPYESSSTRQVLSPIHGGD